MYLDFKKISKEIPFQRVLDNLNIPYTIKGKYLKGKYKDIFFVVDTEQNIFVNPDNKNQNGSIINFLALITNGNVRTAAEELNNKYLAQTREPKRALPELSLYYHPILAEYGISRETAEKYEVGVVKSKSIFAGKLAFRCYENEEPIGYVAYDMVENRWIFPRNFKRPLYNFKSYPQVIVVCDMFDCLSLVDKGIENVVCLIGKSMTTSQEERLKRSQKILLLHPEPENITIRLINWCYIKAPPLIKPIRNYSVEEILSF